MSGVCGVCVSRGGGGAGAGHQQQPKGHAAVNMPMLTSQGALPCAFVTSGGCVGALRGMQVGALVRLLPLFCVLGGLWHP